MKKGDKVVKKREKEETNIMAKKTQQMWNGKQNKHPMCSHYTKQ